MQNSRLDNYLKNFESVYGYTGQGAMRLMLALDQCQIEGGQGSNYFEVGVCQGRSAILLGLLASKNNKKLFVCDLFSDQKQNISRSGNGVRTKFEGNYRKFVGNLDNLKIYSCNSNLLGKIKLKKEVGLFHIDGGHTAQETLFDLKFASTKIVPNGIILLDDPFNYRFPGASEGMNYFLDKNPNYVPFILGKNHIAICHEDFYLRNFDYFYMQRTPLIRDLASSCEFVDTKLYRGREILIYGKTK